MKTYSLKNKEALERISALCPSFPDKLQDACERELDDDGVEVTIYIQRDDLEIVEPYSPNKWNNYPEVEPPVGVMMRCELCFCHGVKCYAGWYDGKIWRSSFGAEVSAPAHYRSWE